MREVMTMAHANTAAHNENDNDYVRIFDTTLRDGEQSPGGTMNVEEKIALARQLERLNVDIIEAGFAVSSPGDFESVNRVAQALTEPIVLSLARTQEGDVDTALRAVDKAAHPGIHIFIATSDIHLKYKLNMNREDVLDAATWAVTRAKKHLDYIEFSCEDASRSDWDYMVDVCSEVIRAGATVINLPDTTGHAIPEEFGRMFAYMREKVPGADKVIWSAHCHNDLGLAVANSLAAVRNGARQVECTVNGIGERAGNAALEEIVMALQTRNDFFGGFECGVNTREIVKSSRLISRMSGLSVQRSKAIVGENAFAHSSGIHQDGILKKRETYEIMDPQTVGWGRTELPLTKHSGRAAVAVRLKHLGFKMSDADVAAIFARFKEIGDKKKFVYDDDLSALVECQITEVPETWSLDYLSVTSGTGTVPTATVRLQKLAGKKSASIRVQD